MLCVRVSSVFYKLMQEIRRVQQDVCNERKLADLRLEIMCVQEDVRRESESEASSTHSPIEYFSHIPSSRYQVMLHKAC